jgi:GNAT superfamily N-acetyltransferase
MCGPPQARVGRVTREEFLATQFPGLTGWIRAAAAAAMESRVHELDGVVAQVSPAVPDRSLFNSVTYRDAAALKAALPELEAVYAGAGVRAWTVWVHESDVEASSLVRAAGHGLDSTPEGMGCALDELIAPDGLDELDHTERPAVDDVRLVLAEGYGFPLEVVRRALKDVPGGSETMVAIARLDGRPACTVQVTIAGDDAGVFSVATSPWARGRGLARRLHYLLLQRARQRGTRTTTLQSSSAGRPVYLALGYRPFGAMNMWERRQPPAGTQAP